MFIRFYNTSSSFQRCPKIHQVLPHVLTCFQEEPKNLHRVPATINCIAHKKNLKSRFSRQIHDWLEAPLPPFFLRTTFRNSAITPASSLIKKSTSLRSSLWCSHCSVAKRQQFSCSLGTAILSFKVGKYVSRLLDFFYCTVAQCFFCCSSVDEQHSYVRVFKRTSRTMWRFSLALQQ